MTFKIRKITGVALIVTGTLLVFGVVGTDDLHIEMLQAGMKPIPTLSLAKLVFAMITGSALVAVGALALKAR
jgi:hypothetical protein